MFAADLLRAGPLTQAEIAREVGVSRASVTRWKQQLAEGGERALRRRKAPGQASYLTAGQRQQLLGMLERGAEQAGFETEQWTLPRIARVIDQHFGIGYHPHSLGRALRTRGWSPQRPIARARERDDALVEAWLKRDWPRRKKGARRSGRAVAFLDETGHPFRARLGTTWAPIGRPPILRRLSQRREVSSCVALQAPLDGPLQLYARHFRSTIHFEQVITALQYFRRQIGRSLLVVWDHLQAHRAIPVRDFLAAHPDEFQVEWLPSYAPELNPEESCNGWVKRDLQNAVPASIDELHHVACRSFRRLGHRADLLASFFRHAGISVT